MVLVGTVTNSGLIEATGGGELDIQTGSIDNSGSGATGILVDGTSTLLVDTANLELTGGGAVALENGSQVLGNGTSGSPDTLENFDNTITGAGSIGYQGNGDLALTNDSGGTIDANVRGETLTIDTGTTVTNTGTLEATNGGTLVIEDNVNGTGTIEANGGAVSIQSGVAIAGTEAVTITGGGLVDFQGSATATLDLDALFLGAGILELDHSQTYDGTVSGYSDSVVFDLHDINFIAGTTTVTNIDPGIDGPGSDELQIADGTHIADIIVEGTGYDANWAVLDWKYGGTLVVDPDVTIASGAVASASGSQMVLFAGSTGTLEITDPSSFTGEIAGLSGSDVLDLAGLDANTTVTATYSNGTTTLAVSDPGHTSFSLTLIDDYSSTFGISFSVTSDGHGGVDIVDPQVTSATVASGGNLELNAPSSEVVSFSGSTGSLVLNDPAGFTGQIIGFTGTAANASGSDEIDLAGINYNSGDFSDTYNSKTGVLTVTDGTHTASLTFVDFTGTFKFASDGSGGTDIFDPPPAPQSSNPPVSVGGPGNDNFVFHPGLGTNAGNFNPPTDTTEHGHFTSPEDQVWVTSIIKEDAVEYVPVGDANTPPELDGTHWHALHNAFHLH